MTVSDLPVLPDGAVVTVGTFDGVHRGHQAVVDELASRARRAGRASVLVTFEPHPAAVLRPDSAPPRLSLPWERAAALAETALDYVVVLPFDRRLAALEPDEFVRRILIERCQLRELVVGHDHGFGRGRQGDLSLLREMGAAAGFVVDVVAPVTDDTGEVVSSSRVREAVAAGAFERATSLLGRPYGVSGRVVRGVGRGGGLGVPTINVAPPTGKLLPPDGVYAVRVEWGGGVAGAMMNQGNRPTFGDPTRWIEAHLFDFDADLYGREVRVEWVTHLRGIQQFASLDQLKGQLQHDQDQARAALAGTVPQP